MVSKTLGIVFGISIVLACGSVRVYAFGAAGHGAGAGPRAGFKSHSGTSAQFLRAENGIFGPGWGCGNGFGGCGAGSGFGCGWGYSPLAFGYLPERVPYYSIFPPVYYDYVDNAPVWKAAIRTSWSVVESSQASQQPSVSAAPSRPPLRIANPYYTETK